MVKLAAFACRVESCGTGWYLLSTMSLRAIILALIGAVFVTTVGYYTDHVAGLNRFVAGQLPIMTYGPLVLVVLFLNPLIRRFGGNWQLRRRELAVIIVATLAAASITNNGLLRYFPRCLVMPIQMSRTEAGWAEQEVLEEAPPILLANDGQYDEDLVLGYISGLSEGDELVPVSRVPWRLWWRTLVFWGSLILLFSVASVCLALIVHPQWSKRELLRYPIAEFAAAVLGSAEGAGKEQPIYRRRWFLVGACALFVYHVNNGLCAWFPDVLIRISLRFDFTAFRVLAPWMEFSWSHGLWRPAIWPIAVALAFYLNKDAAFSVGISHILSVALGGALIAHGVVHSGGTFITGTPFHYQRAGSCLALAVMLLYLGRHYYARVALAATGRRPMGTGMERVATVSCRVLVVCLVALVVILTFWARLPWPFAVAFVGMVMLAYLSVARITAEIGVFYVQIIWFPCAVLFAMCGVNSLGTTAFVTLGVLSTIFVAQPEECLMPFVVQGLRIGDVQGAPVGRLGSVAAVAFGLALLVAVPSAIWIDYSYGGAARWWDSYGQPRLPFTEVQKAKAQLEARGQLESSRSAATVERLAAVRPTREFLWATGLGFALVILTSMARLRWTWWPIHPVLFLIWDTWASMTFFFSFLVAWAIKAALDYTGARAHVHQQAKDLMVGVVAGELLGGLLWMVVGWIAYAATGKTPPYYNIFPY